MTEDLKPEPQKSRDYSYTVQEYGEHKDKNRELEAEKQQAETERVEAIQECDKLKTQLTAVSSELAAYKKAKEQKGLFTREKLKNQAARISREDELSRELRKAKAFISACGLSDYFSRYKFTKTRGSELE